MIRTEKQYATLSDIPYPGIPPWQTLRRAWDQVSPTIGDHQVATALKRIMGADNPEYV